MLAPLTFPQRTIRDQGLNAWFRSSILAHLTILGLVSLLTFEAAGQVQRDPIRLTHGPMLGMSTSHSIRVWGRTSDPSGSWEGPTRIDGVECLTK